jgi:hypothetical protein
MGRSRPRKVLALLLLTGLATAVTPAGPAPGTGPDAVLELVESRSTRKGSCSRSTGPPAARGTKRPRPTRPGDVAAVVAESSSDPACVHWAERYHRLVNVFTFSRTTSARLSLSANAGRASTVDAIEEDFGVIHNVHERTLPAPADEVGALLDTLAGEHDRLWPRDRWPAMRFERPLDARVPDEPLRLGARGGHGPIIYEVSRHVPGRLVAFRFCPDTGLRGEHRFEVIPAGDGAARLRHTIDARPVGSGRLRWPLVMRPLHDALIEEALDNAEAAAGGHPRQHRSLRVAFLRFLFDVHGSGRARPVAPTPVGAVSAKASGRAA